jgi:hypothetical protein
MVGRREAYVRQKIQRSSLEENVRVDPARVEYDFPEFVAKSISKAGVSNVLDGSKDDLIWKPQG